MGRTVPTFRQLIDDAIARWSKFRRALRREDQEYFDRLFRRVRSYTQAATYQASDNPMEAILLSIALDQEKRLDALERIVQPPEPPAGSTLTLHAPTQSQRESTPEPAADSTLRRHNAGRSRRSALAKAAAGSTFLLNASSEASSPPEEYLEQLDASRDPGENEQPDKQPEPHPRQRLDTSQQLGTDPQRDAGLHPNTDEQRDTTRWLDFRSLPEPARDEAVADRAEPDAPPAD